MISIRALSQNTSQRKLSAVPKGIWLAFAVALIIQISLQSSKSSSLTSISTLPTAPTLNSLSLSSFGDKLPIYYTLLLWLQAFDNQPGISVPYAKLDYPQLIAWLSRLSELVDHHETSTQKQQINRLGNHYVMTLASRIYTNVNDDQRKRLILNFIHQQFIKSPSNNWRWMAEATLIAKHKLKDMKLALYYAEELSRLATAQEIPRWAKDMHIILLEELDEYESAKLLIGALLTSGELTDPYEINFLTTKLEQLNDKKTTKK